MQRAPLIPQHNAEPPTVPCRPDKGAADWNFDETCKLQGARAGQFRRGRWARAWSISRRGSAPQFTSVLDLLRDGGLDIARAAVQRRARRFPAARGGIPAAGAGSPRKSSASASTTPTAMPTTATPEAPKYPSMFYRAPGSLVGHRQPIVRPRESEQLDYEGEIALVIGRAGRRIAHEPSARLCRRRDAVQRGHHPRLDAARQIQRDAGQELGRQRQHRALDRDRRRDRSRQAAAFDGEGQRRGDAGRHHRQHDQVVRGIDRLCQHLHDAQARRYHRHRHAGQARARDGAAALAQAGRRGRNRSAADRRAAQHCGGGTHERRDAKQSASSPGRRAIRARR